MRTLGPVPFGALAPDQPDLGNPGAIQAHNCLPRVSSFGPLPGLENFGDALDGKCLGAIAQREEDADATYMYAGDATKLYYWDGDTWEDANTGLTTTARWEFVKWGSQIFCTSLENEMYKATLGDTTFTLLDDSESNVKGRHLAVVRNHVVLGYVADLDGVGEARVRWSAFNDPENWEVSSITMGDFQDLRGEGGAIRAVTSGTTGIVFQERAVWRMEFVGKPFVFRFDKLEESRGAIASGSVQRFGDRAFFWAEDGARMITPGGPSQPIGEEWIDREVLSDLDTAELDNMVSAIIEDAQTVIWAYAGSGNTDGNPNKLVLYNWASGKWSTGELDLEYLFQAAQSGKGIDDTSWATDFPSGIDTVPGSFDDPQWSGGTYFLTAFDLTHTAAGFTGDPLTAEFTTKEVQHTPGGRTFVNYVRPIVDGGTNRVRVISRSNQKDAETASPYVSENDDGLAPCRANARYHRYQVEVSGGFTDAIGVEPYGRAAGNR